MKKGYLVNAPKASRDRGYRYWVRIVDENNQQIELVEIEDKRAARAFIAKHGAKAWNF